MQLSAYIHLSIIGAFAGTVSAALEALDPTAAARAGADAPAEAPHGPQARRHFPVEIRPEVTTAFPVGIKEVIRVEIKE